MATKTKQYSDHVGLDNYMSYLLRYVSFPVTKQALKKKAVSKRFHRLVKYIDSLPEDLVYDDSETALQDLQNCR